MAWSKGTTTSESNGACATIPDFRRLSYFHGQLLTAHDLQTEQGYFREKLKLHNRCLHGYGIVCGLEVSPQPAPKDCEPEAERDRAQVEQQIEEITKQLAALDQPAGAGTADEQDREKIADERNRLEAWLEYDRRRLAGAPSGKSAPARRRPGPGIVIGCGLALDCEGNEIVVRAPVAVDVWGELPPEQRRRLEGGPADVYVSLCFCEQRVDPTRSFSADPCGAVADCTYARVRDSFDVRVSLDHPARDARCDPCCSRCEDGCVLVARICEFDRAKPVTAEMIDLTCRRMVATYAPTTITGVSWRHGATYSVDEARQVLGTDDDHGIEVRFSRDVLTSTLRPGVVDFTVIAGGRGQAGGIYSMPGQLVKPPNARLTRWFRYHQLGRESLQHGDRLAITVRTPFVLDDCCQPVDGLNVGGRVPLLPEYERFDRGHPPKDCPAPPSGTGRWTTGNGSGGVFESWFFIG